MKLINILAIFVFPTSKSKAKITVGSIYNASAQNNIFRHYKCKMKKKGNFN